MSLQAAERRVAELGNAAGAEWTVAASLAQTPAARANAEYVEGWGMLMLSQYADYNLSLVVDDDDLRASAHAEVRGLPTRRDAIDGFIKATKDDPENALYWQSLGDALGPPIAFPGEEPMSGADASADPDYSERSLAAYRQALKLDPKNWLVSFYVAGYEIVTDPDHCLADLRRAAQANPSNGMLLYVIAQEEIRQTAYDRNWRNAGIYPSDPGAVAKAIQDLANSSTSNDYNLAADAMSLVREGNSLPECDYPIYRPPVPRMLAVAFDYRGLPDAPFALLASIRNIARDFAGYADVAALSGDLPDAVYADQLSIGLGERLMGDMRIVDNERDGHTVIIEIIGMATAATGYHSLAELLQEYGDPRDAQEAQQEYDQFRSAYAQWQKLRRSSMEQSDYDSY